MTTRGRGQVRECPVRHAGAPCKARVGPGRLMCSHHWRQVSRDVRTAVYTTWRAWAETHDATDWDLYMSARQAALDSVGDQHAEP